MWAIRTYPNTEGVHIREPFEIGGTVRKRLGSRLNMYMQYLHIPIVKSYICKAESAELVYRYIHTHMHVAVHRNWIIPVFCFIVNAKFKFMFRVHRDNAVVMKKYYKKVLKQTFFLSSNTNIKVGNSAPGFGTIHI